MIYILFFISVLLCCWLWFKNTKNSVRDEQQYIKDEEGPLTAEHIKLIQGSWHKVLPIKAQAAELFYGRLFELDPSTRVLFRGKLDYQGDKLMTTLNVVVNSLEKVDEVIPMLTAMGTRHLIYGVKKYHYETVGTAFLWVLEQSLGDDFTEEVEEAWNIAYGLISSTMMSVEK